MAEEPVVRPVAAVVADLETLLRAEARGLRRDADERSTVMVSIAGALGELGRALGSTGVHVAVQPGTVIGSREATGGAAAPAPAGTPVGDTWRAGYQFGRADGYLAGRRELGDALRHLEDRLGALEVEVRDTGRMARDGSALLWLTRRVAALEEQAAGHRSDTPKPPGLKGVPEATPDGDAGSPPGVRGSEAMVRLERRMAALEEGVRVAAMRAWEASWGERWGAAADAGGAAVYTGPRKADLEAAALEQAAQEDEEQAEADERADYGPPPRAHQDCGPTACLVRPEAPWRCPMLAATKVRGTEDDGALVLSCGYTCPPEAVPEHRASAMHQARDRSRSCAGRVHGTPSATEEGWTPPVGDLPGRCASSDRALRYCQRTAGATCACRIAEGPW